MFNGRLKRLIKESDLKYLSTEKRKNILENNSLYKISFFNKLDIFIVNRKVKNILNGEVFRLAEEEGLNYHNLLSFSNLFSSVKDFKSSFYELKTSFCFDYLFKTDIEIPNIFGLCKTKKDLFKILVSNAFFLNFYILEIEKMAKYCDSVKQLLLLLNNRNILELVKFGKVNFIEDFRKSILKNKKGWDFFDIYNLDNINTIEEEKRRKNISLVNNYQKKLLGKYNVDISDLNEKERSLVLYYREGDTNKFLFFLIVHILQKYIETGKSKIFNKLRLTSRHQNNYFRELKDLKNLKIDYFYDDFKRQSTIFANIIHLAHSTVIEEGHEYMETSFPIIGLANFADRNKSTHFNTIRIPKNRRYIKLRIKQGATYNEYGEETLDYPKEVEKEDRLSNFQEFFDELIKGIQELENKMLEEVKEK